MDKGMVRAFICSPYRGDTELNVEIAKAMCRYAIDLGYAPYAPHLYLPGILSDDIQHERDLSISIGIRFLETCDVMLVFGDPTEGMKREIAAFNGIIRRVYEHQLFNYKA